MPNKNIFRKIKIEPFLLALLGMILVAYLFPFLGSDNGPLHINLVTTYAVSLVFFFYGLGLSPEKLKSGLSNWKLPIVIQLATFVLIPLIALALRPLFTSEQGKLLWMGIFFMAALPGTVSSSVVMVSIAHGNVSAAIFNASISSLIGVVVTPLWMGLVLDNETVVFDFKDVILKLAIQVVLPVAFGMLLNKALGRWAAKNKRYITWFDQLTILLIVLNSFSESFERRLFEEYQLGHLVLILVGMAGLFFLVYFIIGLVSGWLNFDREDTITARFCGSKKSLIQGAVMSKVLFGSSPTAGIMLLPIMLYHALQLVIVSYIAQKIRGTYKSVPKKRS